MYKPKATLMSKHLHILSVSGSNTTSALTALSGGLYPEFINRSDDKTLRVYFPCAKYVKCGSKTQYQLLLVSVLQQFSQ